MSKLIIIKERERDIGGFLVGRLLPTSQKRMIGPFIFIDHIGPEKVGLERYVDVDQHPHIGLATLTFLFQGEIIHKDSLGSEQRITPGSVNWMVAGQGVTHTERTPDDLRDGQEREVHGYQIWVALPKEMEDMPAEFHHIGATDLPTWEDKGAKITLIAGTAFGKSSPVPVQSKLFMINIRTTSPFALNTQALFGELGICVTSGAIVAHEQRIEKGEMLISDTAQLTRFTIEANSQIVLVGGTPFPEKRYIHWNFVSSELDKIRAAKTRWNDKKFPRVPGDDTFVDLPY